MKRLEHQIEELQRRRFEIDLEATINDLFLGCPTLCGFSIRDVANLSREGEACQIDGELFLADVGVLSEEQSPAALAGDGAGPTQTMPSDLLARLRPYVGCPG